MTHELLSLTSERSELSMLPPHFWWNPHSITSNIPLDQYPFPVVMFIGLNFGIISGAHTYKKTLLKERKFRLWGCPARKNCNNTVILTRIGRIIKTLYLYMKLISWTFYFEKMVSSNFRSPHLLNLGWEIKSINLTLPSLSLASRAGVPQYAKNESKSNVCSQNVILGK